MNTLHRAIASFFIVGALWSTPAGATDKVSCSDIDKSATTMPSRSLNTLNQLFNAGCLGGSEDDWSLSQAVQPTMHTVPQEKNLDKIRSTVVGELTSIYDALSDEKNLDDSNKQLLREALEKAMEIFKGDTPLTLGPHNPEYWKYSVINGKAYVGIDVNRELSVCKDKDRAEECKQGYAEAKTLVRYTTVTKRTLDYISAAMRRALANEVHMLNTRWGHYFNDARSQFFWELGLNGMIYDTSMKEETGLTSPPNYQVILLHPSVGLEYLDSKPGDRFREAIVLEGIGYNRWCWKDGDMKLPLGASLIGVYGDRSSAPQFGWGALFHYNNNLSLGVTRRGSHTGAILSLDIAKLFLKQGDDKQYNFKYRLPW